MRRQRWPSQRHCESLHVTIFSFCMFMLLLSADKLVKFLDFRPVGGPGGTHNVAAMAIAAYALLRSASVA